MQTTQTTNAKRDRTVDAVATFVSLMHACERGEFHKAAAAQAELARLGVQIKLSRKKVQDASK